MSSTVAPEVLLDSHIIIVTGANAGIGYETARDLYLRGAKVVMAVRSRTRGEAAKNRLEAEAKKKGSNVGELDLMILDLASLASVRNFAAEFAGKYSRLDVLVNNAGLISQHRTETEDKFETSFGVNHLGPFLLTMLLLDTLKRSAPSRIVNVSSRAYTKGTIHWDDLQLTKNYDHWTSYSQSKLANILFTRELAARLKGTEVTAYSLHPGVVRTEIWKNMSPVMRFMVAPMKIFFKSSEAGAKTSIYCATAPELASVSGGYYEDMKEVQPLEKARSSEDATRLWDVSCKLVGWQEPNVQEQECA